ncbi:hypothetical protein GCM10027168_67300 [Streptomyces capparidis]
MVPTEDLGDDPPLCGEPPTALAKSFQQVGHVFQPNSEKAASSRSRMELVAILTWTKSIVGSDLPLGEETRKGQGGST